MTKSSYNRTWLSVLTIKCIIITQGVFTVMEWFQSNLYLFLNQEQVWHLVSFIWWKLHYLKKKKKKYSCDKFW